MTGLPAAASVVPSTPSWATTAAVASAGAGAGRSRERPQPSEASSTCCSTRQPAPCSLSS